MNDQAVLQLRSNLLRWSTLSLAELGSPKGHLLMIPQSGCQLLRRKLIIVDLSPLQGSEEIQGRLVGLFQIIR